MEEIMNQTTFNKTKKLIQRFEGFSPHAYTCAGGFRTIGYGHRVRTHEDMALITMAQANRLLEEDIGITAQAVARLITVPLKPNQWMALVSFTFNLGAAALQRSTLRAKVNRNDHGDVPREFLKWVYARGQKCPGLIHRRKIEANIYKNKGGITCI
jgi:lysozyme